MRALRFGLAGVALISVAAALGSGLPRAVQAAVPAWLVAAVALRALATLTGALRWWFILRALGAEGMSAIGSLTLSLEALWLSLGLPSSVGGDVWRVHRVRRRLPVTGAIAAALLDRSLGAVVLLAVAGAGALSSGHGSEIVPAGACVVAGVLASLAVLALPRARVFAREMLGAAARAAARPGDWAAAWLLAAASGATLVASYFAVAVAVDLAVPNAALLWAVPLILLARTIPLTPSGVGVGELAGTLLLAGQVEPERAVVFAFLGFAAVLPTAAFGGALLLGDPQRGAAQ